MRNHLPNSTAQKLPQSADTYSAGQKISITDEILSSQTPATTLYHEPV
jgi:hypothetical protein